MALSMILAPRMEMRLENRMEMCLEPHSPLKKPRLTPLAENKEGNLERVIERGKLSAEEKMLEIEAALLNRWSYTSCWERYLDMPLMAHAYCSLGLKELGYDSILGVEDAGTPYGDIFRIMGFDVFSIDYSHHKRNTEKPIIEKNQLEQLKKKNKVLLTDIDIVTGKTINAVANYLKNERVNIEGVYIGLSEWPGLELETPHIGHDVTDFNFFWKECGKTRQLRDIHPSYYHDTGIIPFNLKLFNANYSLENRHYSDGPAAAKQIALYLLENA